MIGDTPPLNAFSIGLCPICGFAHWDGGHCGNTQTYTVTNVEWRYADDVIRERYASRRRQRQYATRGSRLARLPVGRLLRRMRTRLRLARQGTFAAWQRFAERRWGMPA